MSILAATAGAAALNTLMTAWSGAQQSMLKAKAIEANNRARIKQLREQFSLESQNLANNYQAVNQQRLKNDILIQESKLQAQDQLASALVGSGVSGRSVDALEAQISNDVAKSHIENKMQSTQQKDSLFLGLKRAGQAMTNEIKYMDTFDFGAEKANNDMATLLSAGQGLGQFGLEYYNTKKGG